MQTIMYRPIAASAAPNSKKKWKTSLTTNDEAWLFRGQVFEDPADWLGFVYVIHNRIANRLYIGKKLLISTRMRTVRGRRRRVRTESDWRTYWGSNSQVHADRDRLGVDGFDRHIVYLVRSKGVLSYLEAKTQFDAQVLLNPQRFYNGIINCRINASHVLNIADVESDARLLETIIRTHSQ
jgi:hypothetical protein